MTIGAVATKDTLAGGQRNTDGLWKHLGLFDAGGLRANGVQYAQQVGQGLELLFTPTSGGIVQAYDREASIYLDLSLSARSIILSTSGGNAYLNGKPIATEPTTQLLGNFFAGVDWTLPQASVWTETPVQINITQSGKLMRLDWNLMLSCPVKGQRVYWSLFQDGALLINAALGAIDAPEANYAMMAYGGYTALSTAGTHRLAIALFGPAGAKIVPGISASLAATEYRS